MIVEPSVDDFARLYDAGTAQVVWTRLVADLPDLIFRASGANAEVNADPKARPDAFEPMAEPTLEALRKVIRDSHIHLPGGLPPMSGVLAAQVYFSSDEPLVQVLPELNENRMFRS
jgi:anthranilate synthase component 1